MLEDAGTIGLLAATVLLLVRELVGHKGASALECQECTMLVRNTLERVKGVENKLDRLLERGP